MLHTYTSGILENRLFLVEGDLVGNYNRALEMLTGKRTALTSFHIDQRGKSPEIEAELGEQYLQSGASHRYCIILSPDQKDADLLHEEFSFDRDLFETLYRNALTGISVVTRVDGLYGDLNDEINEYETLEDLLQIKKVAIELRSPSGFLEKSNELQQQVAQLRKNADLLLENDSAVPRRILELVRDVGDVRNANLGNMTAAKDVATFYTDIFGGVCIFKDFKLQNQEQFLYNLSGAPVVSITSAQKSDSPTKSKWAGTVVLYQKSDSPPNDGPSVQFIAFSDKERVIRFLVENGYADYTQQLLEARLIRVEDETLLSKGLDVVAMGKEDRIKWLHQYRDEMLFGWYELKEIVRNLNKGHQLSEIIQQYSADAKALLLTPIQDLGSQLLSSMQGGDDGTRIVERVLTMLVDMDYEKMATYNRRKLETIYAQADAPKRIYLESIIRAHNARRQAEHI